VVPSLQPDWQMALQMQRSCLLKRARTALRWTPCIWLARKSIKQTLEVVALY